jgi:hypothetical protein
MLQWVIPRTRLASPAASGCTIPSQVRLNASKKRQVLLEGEISQDLKYYVHEPRVTILAYALEWRACLEEKALVTRRRISASCSPLACEYRILDS